MSHLALYLLGPPRIERLREGARDSEPVQISRRKVVALLAYLAVTRTPHSRDALATLLWPERSQSRARAYLRRALSELNRTLGQGFLTIDRETAGLDPSADLSLDVAVFRQLLTECETHDHPTTELCSECVTVLEEAVELYSDDFMAGFTLRDSPEFDEWQFFQYENLRDELARTLERLMRWLSSQGEYDRATAYARRWLALDPLHEPVHRHLMELYAQAGRRAAVERQYQECVQILEAELGAPPAEATTALYEQLQRRPKESDDRLFPAALPRHNLPIQATPFIGREAELAEIAALLQDPDCRLLTLVGPGGSGKTRLALEAAAARLGEYGHGTYFISLAPLESAESIAPTVANALGFRFNGEGTPQQQLLDFLRQRNLLLILDNYEHLLTPPACTGGGAGATDLVSDIIKTAPHVKVLATSRARLNVGGEHRFPVGGMDFPEPSLAVSSDAECYSAIQLFVQGARRALPGFQLKRENLDGVARICYLVNGMPLGIRLAAAWVALFTAAEIAARIDQTIDILETGRSDVPERQRSMRATFDHSWELLGAREREIFPALSVFRGGFTSEVAMAVAGATPRELMTLVEKSLVDSDRRGRFQMHELLRSYAAEKLATRPHDALDARTRHCTYYAAALERWGAELKGHGQLTALGEMDLEIDNARAAWDWAVDQGQVEGLGCAIEGLFLFYEWRARYLDAETMCQVAAETLEKSHTPGALRLRSRILAWQGVINRHMGRGTAARHLAEQSLALLQRPECSDQDTRWERAAVLKDLGWLTAEYHRQDADLQEALRLLKQSLSLCREVDDRWEMAHVLHFIGSVCWWYLSDLGQAHEMLEESLAIFRKLGDQRLAAYPLALLGGVAAARGQLDEGERLARESLAIHRQTDDRHIIEVTMRQLASILYTQGKNIETQSLLEEHIKFCEYLGIRRYVAESHASLGQVKVQLGQYEDARIEASVSLAIARGSQAPLETIWPIGLLGQVELAEGAYAEALALFHESVTRSQESGAQYWTSVYLSFLSMSYYGLGQSPQALKHLAEALQITFEFRLYYSLGFALPATALFLSGQGEPERAVELYALASRYPFVANSRWFEDVVGKPIASAAAALPPEVVATAQERGRARDLWETAEELLQVLQK